MNFRALALLTLFLLFQAGEVTARLVVDCSTQAATTCVEGCCKFMTSEEASHCCHLTDQEKESVPTTPAQPASGGRELVPSVLWNLIEDPSALPSIPADPALASPSSAWHAESLTSSSTVALTVLHCAFLL